MPQISAKIDDESYDILLNIAKHYTVGLSAALRIAIRAYAKLNKDTF